MKNYTKSKYFLISLIVIIFLLINSFLAYYFFIYSKKQKFPTINSTVNLQNLDQAGFQKIDISEGKASFFVPKNWIIIDKENAVYGDILNGSNAYVSITPNNLGVLKPELCTNVANEAKENLKTKNLYTNLEMISSTIKKYGDIEGCAVVYTAKIGMKIYQIDQFFIFRKSYILMLNTQFQSNLSLEKRTIDTILTNIIVN